MINKKMIMLIGAVIYSSFGRMAMAQELVKLSPKGQAFYDKLIKERGVESLKEEKIVRYAINFENNTLLNLISENWRHGAFDTIYVIKLFIIDSLIDKYYKKTLSSADNNEINLTFLSNELEEQKKTQINTPGSVFTQMDREGWGLAGLVPMVALMGSLASAISLDYISKSLNYLAKNTVLSSQEKGLTSVKDAASIGSKFLFGTAGSIIAVPYLFDIKRWIGEHIDKYKNIRAINNIIKTLKAMPVKP